MTNPNYHTSTASRALDKTPFFSWGIETNRGAAKKIRIPSYPYGFNGQERDDEVNGNGNTNTALYWQYDTRTGRRWNTDPRPTIGISEFACFENNPILYSDILGDYVDYKKFGDRVRVGFKRLTNKNFRADFNSKKADENNTFVYDKSAGYPLLQFAQPIYNGPPQLDNKHMTPEWDVKYSTLGVGVELKTKELENAIVQKEIPFEIGLPKETDADGSFIENSQTIVKEHVVPNTEISFNANKYPDKISISGTVLDNALVNGKPTWTVTTNSGAGGTVRFTMTSSRTYSRNPEKPVTKSIGTATYWKYRTITYPALKLSTK